MVYAQTEKAADLPPFFVYRGLFSWWAVRNPPCPLKRGMPTGCWPTGASIGLCSCWASLPRRFALPPFKGVPEGRGFEHTRTYSSSLSSTQNQKTAAPKDYGLFLCAVNPTVLLQIEFQFHQTNISVAAYIFIIFCITFSVI